MCHFVGCENFDLSEDLSLTAQFPVLFTLYLEICLTNLLYFLVQKMHGIKNTSK